MHTRYCPNCDTEFRPDIPRCSDCGGDLEDRDDEEGAEERRAEEASEPEVQSPPGDYHTVFNAIDVASLKEAAACLAGAGIPFRAAGYRVGYRVLVRSEDLSAAREALAGRDGTITVGDDAQSFVGVEGGACPACGAKVPAGVVECPECALVVGAEAATCASCGSLLGPADERCPVCGASEE